MKKNIYAIIGASIVFLQICTIYELHKININQAYIVSAVNGIEFPAEIEVKNLEEPSGKYEYRKKPLMVEISNPELLGDAIGKKIRGY